MGSTEQHHGAADVVIAAPLLPSPAPEPPRRNMFAFVCATLASMTTILMGYNLALMSGAELFMREDLGLTDEQVEVLSGSMNVFMLGSILAAGWAADAVGRRGTIVLANAFLMAGALAMSLGGSYAALLAARFVTSVGVGFAVVVAPVYAAEIAPASTRGMLSSLPEIFVNAGILLSYVSNYALAGLPPPTIRRIFTYVLALQFFHQASGIDIIVLYTQLVLKKAGISSNRSVLAATVAVGVVKTGFILVATLFSDRVGRRPLLLASTAGIAVSLTSLAITLCAASVTTAASVPAASVASLLAYVAAFSVGLGPGNTMLISHVQGSSSI